MWFTLCVSGHSILPNIWLPEQTQAWCVILNYTSQSVFTLLLEYLWIVCHDYCVVLLRPPRSAVPFGLFSRPVHWRTEHQEVNAAVVLGMSIFCTPGILPLVLCLVSFSTHGSKPRWCGSRAVNKDGSVNWMIHSFNWMQWRSTCACLPTAKLDNQCEPRNASYISLEVFEQLRACRPGNRSATSRVYIRLG